MAWCGIGDKPLPESMMTQFTDVTRGIIWPKWVNAWDSTALLYLHGCRDQSLYDERNSFVDLTLQKDQYLNLQFYMKDSSPQCTVSTYFVQKLVWFLCGSNTVRNHHQRIPDIWKNNNIDYTAVKSQQIWKIKQYIQMIAGFSLLNHWFPLDVEVIFRV